jgi:PAS domain S-box-containing protein
VRAEILSGQPGKPSARVSESGAEERSLRLQVDGLRDFAIFMLDRTGRVATWNAGAERFQGYSADEILGRHISCFFLP